MATFKIDTAHSEITFKVRHLMITNVTGSFTEFDGTLEAAKEDFSDAKVSFTAAVKSVNTNNPQRDEHLRGDDFFAADKFPELKFVSTAIQKTGDDEYKLTGDLTIRDVTKPITLDVTYTGTVVDPWGQVKAGFELTGKLNRKEYGLVWSAVTETGSVMVSDEVKLNLNVQVIKQA